MNCRDTQFSGSAMCEMYSPRMREMFKTAANTDPPTLDPMVDHVQQRRAIYLQTVTWIRTIISQQKMMLPQQEMMLPQQEMMHTDSNYHMVKGQMDELWLGSKYTYGAPGVGDGYANMDLLHSAQLSRQAGAGMIAGAQDALVQVQILEKQWRAVE